MLSVLLIETLIKAIIGILTLKGLSPSFLYILWNLYLE